MAKLLTSGRLGVNFGYHSSEVGYLGGWVDYEIYDDGKAKFVFRNSETATWEIARAYGIQIKYDGNKQNVNGTDIYPESSAAVQTTTITIEGFRRERAYMTVNGYSGNTDYAGPYGSIADGEMPTSPADPKEYNDVMISWDVPNVSPTATITASTPFTGAQTTVSWKFSDADGDSVSLVRLVRYYKAAGKTSYSGTTILSGPASGNSYKDAIPTSYAGGSVYYEVLFEDPYGGSGTARTSAADVISNSAPTVPGTPKLPGVINAGASITVSWDASTDPDNNLEGYILERSVDNGGSWTQVYQGAAQSASTTVPTKINTIMYRVKAYDYYGAESAYASTPINTVITNTPPSIPGAITLPSEIVRGKKITVRWGASADAEDSTITYELERSVDGGEFTLIRSTTSRTYSDTVENTWKTVQYRVRAKDPSGAASDYSVSQVQKVAAGVKPVLSLISPAAGSNLGTVSEAFSMNYKVKNMDTENSLTLHYYVDGEYITNDPNAFPPSQYPEGEVYEVSNRFESAKGDWWYRIPNGEHVITIRAVLANTEQEVYAEASFTFTKLVRDAVITLSEPMTASEKPTVCVISVNGSIPADAQLTVEVTNNGNDSSPVWEDATAQALSGMNHVFTNGTQSNGWAFNFRVTVSGDNTRGYITSIQGGFQ